MSVMSLSRRCILAIGMMIGNLIGTEWSMTISRRNSEPVLALLCCTLLIEVFVIPGGKPHDLLSSRDLAEVSPLPPRPPWPQRNNTIACRPHQAWDISHGIAVKGPNIFG